MRILVTGSRDWNDSYAVVNALMEATRGISWHKVTVVHGDCPTGLDSIADAVASEMGMTPEPHPAHWDKHGKAAGPIRNQEMVDAGADICLAFFQPGAQNKGTGDCVARAKRAGIPVKRYPEGGDREPAGGSPDSPPARVAGVPGPGGQCQPVENHPVRPGKSGALVGF